MTEPPLLARTLGIAALNALSTSEFVSYLAGVFEKTPWIAAAASAQRPFASRAALCAAMEAILRAAPQADQHALLCAHPMLGSRGQGPEPLTAESAAEQASRGLDDLAAGEAARLAALNAAYAERFGFPFIIAVRGQKDRTAILRALEQRLGASPQAEFATALAEVVKIAGFRLDALVAEDAATAERPLTLSLHVLDTARGGPGVGLAFTLRRFDAAGPVMLAAGESDAAGRWALDPAVPLQPGIHEILFEAEAYQARFGTEGFYDLIPIRFRLVASGGHYHLPLILSPFGYSTYRGG